MRYRLGLDLGATSLGWAAFRLSDDGEPCALIRSGVRIFSDGRNPKDGSSLAVSRRNARSMRRRRDRLLRRKKRLLTALTELGLFPKDLAERRSLEPCNPYELRARGLDQALAPYEFGRALFHLNQRRGFKSNRKTDKAASEAGLMKSAIEAVKLRLANEGARTIGEWLYQRMKIGLTVRARYRETRVEREGKSRLDKSYDLYIDRAMIEAEFDALWNAQSALQPHLYTRTMRERLHDILFFQRPLKPVVPGRCTFIPDELRAPLALPSVQRFRIYQEVNNLRLLDSTLRLEPLSRSDRDKVVQALEKSAKRSFDQIRKLLGLEGTDTFSLEDAKRQELKGNRTSAELSKKHYFGPEWHDFPLELQDEIVLRLLNEESDAVLINWLQQHVGVSEGVARALADASLPDGYGALSLKAIQRILPELCSDVITYDQAVRKAGFDSHSALDHAEDGEIWPDLPYYGEVLQRHIGIGTGNPLDLPERRFGRIANPTVHIGLNQLRLVVNSLIRQYGHPSQVVVEVARDLKKSKRERDDDNRRQAENQKRNQRIRTQIADVLNTSLERVRHADVQKVNLWEELSFDAADRRCPYSGVQISLAMLLSDEVEIEHILPFSRTLDDSLSNKTVSMRRVNRIKANQTPWEAFGKQSVAGIDYSDILRRAERMPRNKRYRFAQDGYEQWLRDDAGFLARALNDTRYLSRLAREYLRVICPKGTWVIPGTLTAKLRRQFGLNTILSRSPEKNRNDHRHHAVDACVVGVTDRALLQQVSRVSAVACGQGMDRLIEKLSLPWPTYRDHVSRAVASIWVSHKPDHSHEAAMHNETAYGLLGNGMVRTHKYVDGQRVREESKLVVIPMTAKAAVHRHGVLPDGSHRPYKGYKGDSNYCIEIFREEGGKWAAQVVSTFQAYQVVKAQGVQGLRNPHKSLSGKPLVMRLMRNDMVRLEHQGELRTLRVATISGNGQVFMAEHNEANTDARNRSKELPYVSKMAGSFKASKARRVTVSPTGVVRDPGFTG